MRKAKYLLESKEQDIEEVCLLHDSDRMCFVFVLSAINQICFMIVN